MSLSLDGYQITRLLRASGISRVYAAIREHDRPSVVVKVYDLADTQILEARIEHEFRLLRELEVENIARALALERTGTQLALVHEWCEGISLEDLAARRLLDLDDFLDIAAQIARTLADVHAQRVIHGAIRPTSIIVDPATRAVSIVDFGLSVLSQREREHISDPAVVEGILPYVSPEQTGRTEREVDVRTDLYSLGATFYELLTGRRAFQGSSPLELIHAQLARRPEPPRRLRPGIPAPLSDLVMKLLEKQPEQRYQSARGLRLDLERLAAALREGRRLDDFVIGADDVSMTLQLPHRLYGRASEIDALIQEFRRATSGTPRFALVTGAAGLGKTALIGQLAEPVMSRHGYLARGKFESLPTASRPRARTDTGSDCTPAPTRRSRWAGDSASTATALGPGPPSRSRFRCETTRATHKSAMCATYPESTPEDCLALHLMVEALIVSVRASRSAWPPVPAVAARL